MILFKKLRFKNFLSYGNYWTELDLNQPGATLIVGNNGVGKSTWLDALTFALFGVSFRNINKPQLINSITGREMVVELEFEIYPNEYKIIRGMKPNIFEIYCNDKLVPQSSEVRDYQKMFEKQILKMTEKSFRQVVVLGSASHKPFMQLPAAERRTIIEDLLDLEIFTVMNKILKDKIDDNERLSNKIEVDIKIVQEKISLVKEHLKEVSTNNKKIVKNKQEQIIHHEKEIEQLNKEIEITLGEISKFQKNVSDYDKLQKKSQKLNALKAQLEQKISFLEKEVQFLNDHENCPTCKQAIDVDFKCDTIQKRKSEIDEVNEGLKKLQETYNELFLQIASMNGMQSVINDLQSEIYIKNININNNNKNIKLLQKEIDEIKSKEKQTTTDKISDLEKEQLKFINSFNECQEQRSLYSAAAVLLKDGGIKTKIIDQYIPVINNLINKYLNVMEFYAQFELDSQFKETIRSRHRDEFSYESFSEGEKQRIDLALLFTWRDIAKMRNSVSTNILIMDEVFDSSLDITGTDQLMNIIREISADNSLFIISHKEQMNDKFTNVIKIIKNKNFSKIEGTL